MNAPHETNEFVNSTEYTVAITFRVEGGALGPTALRRARKIAERLANHAARAAQVVEVTAVGGVSTEGKQLASERIRFAAANTGRGTYADPTLRDRYLDPEFERALRSLADAKAAAREATEADRQRRQDLGCLNTNWSSARPATRCLCVYCSPVAHEHGLRLADAGTPDPLTTPRCICGRGVAAPGLACSRHRDHELVVLDGDPPALQRLARRLQRPEPDDPGHGIDGPELPPPGH